MPESQAMREAEEKVQQHPDQQFADEGNAQREEDDEIEPAPPAN